MRQTTFSPFIPPFLSPYLSFRCFETFDEGSEFFIVTELVAGGELFDRIVAKTHYTEKEARDLVKMFLETMAYMHGKGVVHRDLKPENLLLCSGNILDVTSVMTFVFTLVFMVYLSPRFLVLMMSLSP